MKGYILLHNDLTKTYYLLSGLHLDDKKRVATSNLDGLIELLKEKINPKRKVQLIIYPGFPESDMEEVKQALSDRKVSYEEYKSKK